MFMRMVFGSENGWGPFNTKWLRSLQHKMVEIPSTQNGWGPFNTKWLRFLQHKMVEVPSTQNFNLYFFFSSTIRLMMCHISCGPLFEKVTHAWNKSFLDRLGNTTSNLSAFETSTKGNLNIGNKVSEIFLWPHIWPHLYCYI